MMRRTKYKHTFDQFVFNNRWAQPRWTKGGNWTILGFGIRYFGPLDYEYHLNIFGFDFRFWFKREIKK